MTWPNPNEKFPIEAYQGLGFLKNFIQDPNIIIGDYTYYDDPEGIENFGEIPSSLHQKFQKDN